MKNTLALTKTLLINSFSLNSFRIKNFKFKNLWILLIIVLVTPSFGVMYYGFCKFTFFLAENFHLLGQTSFMVAIGYNLISIVILIFGLIQVSSIFYYSNDIESLLVLPVKSTQVVNAKFIIVYIQELIFVALFMTPIIFNVGYVIEAGSLFYLYSIVAIFLAPILPLAISTIIMMFVMSATSLSKRKDLFRVVSMFVVLVLYLGFNFYISTTLSSSTLVNQPNFILSLLEDNQALLKTIGFANPLAKWLGLSLSGGSNALMYAVVFIASNIGIWGLILFVADRLYIRGIINGRDVKSSKKVLSDQQLDKSISKSSKPYIALAKADLITLFKTPVFLLNCVSVLFILPVMFGLMYFVGDSEVISILKAANLDGGVYLTLAIAFTTGFMTAINPTASTTFSRMGKSLWVARIAPLSAFEQMVSRLIAPMLFTVVGAILAGGIFIFTLNIDMFTFIQGALLGILVSTPILIFGLIVDTLKPILNWENPQKAVKNNLNVIISMVFGVAVMAGSGFLVFKLIDVFSIEVITLLLITLYVVLTIVLTFVSKKLITEKLSTIE